MTKTTRWVPVLQQAIIRKSSNLSRILNKLHLTRKKLLRKNPDAYIDYSA